ncbi:MAG TPA: GntR family transcriptional regulator [Ramlibacter sp.]|jgi:DNA-binding GntR family transcriptional regulator
MGSALGALQSPDERVYSSIYNAIQAHRLSPGVKLKEVELTQLFKVSRTSVRSALLRLSHKGLVEIAPNRGAVVAQLSADDCRQLFEARRAVEGTIVEVLAQARDPAVVAELRSVVEAQRQAFAAGNRLEGHRIAFEFHRRLAQVSGNRILAQFVDDLLARMPLVILTLGASPTTGESGDAGHADHAELVEAIAAGQADAARRLLVEHLQHLEAALAERRRDGAQTLGEMLGLASD